MILQCSNCAGNITVNDRDIRHGIVTCDYCTAVLRITNSGLEAYKKQLLERSPPDKIFVTRNHPDIKITIPISTKHQRVLGQPTGPWIWIPFGVLSSMLVLLIVLALIVSSKTDFTLGYALFCIGSMGAGVVFLILSFIGAESHPHLQIKDGILVKQRDFPGQPYKLPVETFKQLYSM